MLIKNQFNPNIKLTKEQEKIITDFHKLYYDLWRWEESDKNRGTLDVSWRGISMIKCPMDLLIYQEIIVEKRPDIIIETGTYNSGSALFMADVCSLINNGHIITIDVNKKDFIKHDRISYFTGYSIQDDLVKQIISVIEPTDKVMVILDSDHRKENVSKELEIYSLLVTSGQYLIIEDTNLNGNPVNPNHGAGPKEAVDNFLFKNNNFTIDQSKERFLLTMNPNGFLLKK